MHVRPKPTGDKLIGSASALAALRDDEMEVAQTCGPHEGGHERINTAKNKTMSKCSTRLASPSMALDAEGNLPPPPYEVDWRLFPRHIPAEKAARLTPIKSKKTRTGQVNLRDRVRIARVQSQRRFQRSLEKANMTTASSKRSVETR